ncbi:MAG: tetratricopeptide repeat protein, partial [Deltaproteobacteria bacterium]|nr:tetratricopeptide repeat protein [Deltaproteobacteria bacterium]
MTSPIPDLRGALVALAVVGCATAPAPVAAVTSPTPVRDVASEERPTSAAATGSARALARGDGSAVDVELANGDLAAVRGAWSAARAAFERAERLAPNDPAAAVGVARATLAEAGVPEGVGEAPSHPTALAVAAKLRSVAARHPEHAALALELGRVLLVLGELREARAPLEVAARLAPDDPEALSSHGIVLLVGGDRDAAVKALARAAE